MNHLENHFKPFREAIVGFNQTYETPYGTQNLLYADWIASGRLYRPIEEKLLQEIGPFVANTHTETSESGTRMTKAYHYAQQIIKKHVNASNQTDALIMAGSGMTTVINKFQRILGLKDTAKKNAPAKERPIVFITHMEHHSNQTSWYFTNCDVVIVPPDENLLVSLDNLRAELEKYKDRPLKIGSFSAASNVTGVINPYHQMAKVMHEYGGVCFVDFAASAPYVEINMHPEDPMEKLDAILFSPHKFLGGPGTSGVLIFDKTLYHNEVPDHPGGGTVDWTNSWGEYQFIDNIELREDGGTPGFLQAIRTALSIQLKEQMGSDKIMEREHQLINKAMDGLMEIEGIRILARKHRNRIGAISFYHRAIHFNLFVKLLSDRFGIQVRGGCACAGTYGHFLLDLDYEKSAHIADKIKQGDLSEKPGWIRWSLHPTMTDAEVDFILDACRQIVENYQEWEKDYQYNSHTNEYQFKDIEYNHSLYQSWFF